MASDYHRGTVHKHFKWKREKGGLRPSRYKYIITVSSTNLFRSRSWRVNWCVLYLHRCALVCNGVWITIIGMNRCAQVFWSGFFIQVMNAITSLQPLERIRNFGPLSFYLYLDAKTPRKWKFRWHGSVGYGVNSRAGSRFLRFTMISCRAYLYTLGRSGSNTWVDFRITLFWSYKAL